MLKTLNLIGNFHFHFKMVELLNPQNYLNLSLNNIEDFSNIAIESLRKSKGKSVTIALVDDKKVTQFNKDFRNKNSTTDVLSFPNESEEFDANDNYLGDIIISVEQAKKQAIENNLSLELEIKQLILHGILHLCGYNHETDNGEMNELELELREKLKIN